MHMTHQQKSEAVGPQASFVSKQLNVLWLENISVFIYDRDGDRFLDDAVPVLRAVAVRADALLLFDELHRRLHAEVARPGLPVPVFFDCGYTALHDERALGVPAVRSLVRLEQRRDLPASGLLHGRRPLELRAVLAHQLVEVHHNRDVLVY